MSRFSLSNMMSKDKSPMSTVSKPSEPLEDQPTFNLIDTTKPPTTNEKDEPIVMTEKFSFENIASVEPTVDRGVIDPPKSATTTCTLSKNRLPVFTKDCNNLIVPSEDDSDVTEKISSGNFATTETIPNHDHPDTVPQKITTCTIRPPKDSTIAFERNKNFLEESNNLIVRSRSSSDLSLNASDLDSSILDSCDEVLLMLDEKEGEPAASYNNTANNVSSPRPSLVGIEPPEGKVHQPDAFLNIGNRLVANEVQSASTTDTFLSPIVMDTVTKRIRKSLVDRFAVLRNKVGVQHFEAVAHVPSDSKQEAIPKRAGNVFIKYALLPILLVALLLLPMLLLLSEFEITYTESARSDMEIMQQANGQESVTISSRNLDSALFVNMEDLIFVKDGATVEADDVLENEPIEYQYASDNLHEENFGESTKEKHDDIDNVATDDLTFVKVTTLKANSVSKGEAINVQNSNGKVLEKKFEEAANEEHSAFQKLAQLSNYMNPFAHKLSTAIPMQLKGNESKIEVAQLAEPPASITDFDTTETSDSAAVLNVDGEADYISKDKYTYIQNLDGNMIAEVMVNEEHITNSIFALLSQHWLGTSNTMDTSENETLHFQHSQSFAYQGSYLVQTLKVIFACITALRFCFMIFVRTFDKGAGLKGKKAPEALWQNVHLRNVLRQNKFRELRSL